MVSMMNIGEYSKDRYLQIYELAVSNKGNCDRIQKAINKAENEAVTVAFLGGSVTEGYNPERRIINNYAKRFCSYFQEKYCKDSNCICVNQGLSATDSMLGLVFADNCIKKVNPDIVFIEYAINNSMDRTMIKTYESLIYKLLEMDSQPAVIPIIVCNRDFYTCSGYMETIAKHYNLPVINLYNVIKQGIDSGSMSWDQYSNDYAHPTEEGHRMIFEGILQLFEHIESMMDYKDYLPNEPCFGREFHTLEYYDRGSAHPIELGSFHETDTLPSFQQGWSYVQGTGNQPFRINIECKSFFLIYEQVNEMEYGEIEILDGDTEIGSIDSYSIYGYHNPEIELVINEEVTRQYQIHIRMRKGDEDKKFSILGFGIVR